MGDARIVLPAGWVEELHGISTRIILMVRKRLKKSMRNTMHDMCIEKKQMSKKEIFRYAFVKSVPIMCSYLFVGMAYGF